MKTIVNAGVPLCEYLTSGSLPTFPTRITLFTLFGIAVLLQLEGGQKAALRKNRTPWKASDVLERYSRQDREGTAQESSRTEKPVAIAALDSR